MAIIIRHRTLSQKTQSAIAGIISKNEWNDTHVIDNVAESDIVFSSTGHTHDGVGSAIAVKCNTLNDSYLGSTNYRNASKYPQANEIPILDGDGYMNIRRVGSTQYSKIQFNDTTTPKSSLYHDYTNNILTLTNVTGINTISLLSTGEVTITPKSTTPLTVTTDNVHLKNIVATDNSEVRLNFKDSSDSIQGYVGYKFHTTASSNKLSLVNPKETSGSGIGCHVTVDGAGNVILNAKGTTGKSYYTHNDASPSSGDEIQTTTATTALITSQLSTYGARVQGNPIGFDCLPYTETGFGGDFLLGSGYLYLPRQGTLTLLCYGGRFNHVNNNVYFAVGSNNIVVYPPVTASSSWYTVDLTYTGATGIVAWSFNLRTTGTGANRLTKIYGVSYSAISP